MLKFPFLAVAVVVSLSAQDKTIDVHRSTIIVHVGKAGLFSAAGHEHWVNAPISGGLVNDSAIPHVEFKVATSKIEVKSDPKIDAKTQAEVQNDMQQKVLESSKYPEIAFRSSHTEKRAEGLWRVQGELTLHGVTKPITVNVTWDGDSYSGKAIIKQTDFGIEPVTAGGGLIKVKNELEISFHIVTVSGEKKRTMGRNKSCLRGFDLPSTLSSKFRKGFDLLHIQPHRTFPRSEESLGIWC